MRCAQPVVRGHSERDRRIDAGQLLDADALLKRRHASAAVPLGKLDPEQTELGEPRQQLKRKPLGFVPRQDMRRNLPLGELAHRPAGDALGVGRPEVHGVGLYHTVLDAPDRCGTAVTRESETMSGIWNPAIAGLSLRAPGDDKRDVSRITRTTVATLILTSVASPALADFTAFLEPNRTPTNRTARGAALGLSLLIIGFEFEYSDTPEDRAANAPSLRSGMFNLLVQTPLTISRLQFYATIGGGAYRERLDAHETTNVGGNVGGGVKISLLGPLRARIDYRVFTLRGSPLHDNPQRIYVGLNLAFCPGVRAFSPRDRWPVYGSGWNPSSSCRLTKICPSPGPNAPMKVS